MDNDARILFLQERDTRARDLNFYRGLSLAVLAGAGTVFFGLMILYARLFTVGSDTNLSQAARDILEQLAFWLPVLGIVAQMTIVFSLVHLHLRIRVTAYRLQQIHWFFGVNPEVEVPWTDPIKTRRRQMQNGHWWFFIYQLPYLVPSAVIIGIWGYIISKI